MQELLCVDGPHAGQMFRVCRDTARTLDVPFTTDAAKLHHWAPEDIWQLHICVLQYRVVTRTYNGRRVDVLALTEDSKQTMRKLFADKLGVGVDFFYSATPQ